MSVELKPCPFCGSEARSENYVIEAAVLCDGCPAKIIRSHGARDDNGLPEAIAAWNTRATQPPAVGVDVSDEMTAEALRVYRDAEADILGTRATPYNGARLQMMRAALTAALRTGGGE